MKKFSFILILILSLTAGAEGTRGGADIINCNGGPFLLFGLFTKDTKSLADIYGGRNINSMPMTYLDPFDGEAIKASILDFLEYKKPEEGRRLREALSHIRFHYVQKVKELETGVSAGLTEHILFGCSRRQIAAQIFDDPVKNQSRVSIVRDAFLSLPSLTQALTKIHEGYLYLAHLNSDDLMAMEAEARKNTNELYNMTGFDSYLLKDLFRKSGWPTDNMTRALFGWLNRVLEMPPLETPSQITFAIQEMIDAGLDPKAVIECQLPLIDFAMGHLAVNIDGGLPGITSPDAAVALIERGASVNARNIMGKTPLHVAVFRQDTIVTKALIKAGADLNAPWCPPGRKEGAWAFTALDLASRSRPFDFDTSADSEDDADLLRQAGAKKAKELGLTCPAIPKPSKKELKKANCGYLKYVVAPWALYK
jgi:hypothetical protein